MENIYHKILVAVDLSEHSDKVVGHAKALASTRNSDLSLVYIAEFPNVAYTDLMPLQTMTAQELEQALKPGLLALAEKHQIPENQVIFGCGHVPTSIADIIESGGYDLLVIGKHPRHGFARILGSTANGILNNIHCDSLVVNV